MYMTLSLVSLLHLFSDSFLFFRALIVSVDFCLIQQHYKCMSVHQLLNYFLAKSNGRMRKGYGKSEQMLEILCFILNLEHSKWCKKLLMKSKNKLKLFLPLFVSFIFLQTHIYLTLFRDCCSFSLLPIINFTGSRQQSSQWSYSRLHIISVCMLCCVCFLQYSMVLLKVLSSYNPWCLKTKCICAAEYWGCR